jgi:hypothetical protein
MKKALQNKKKLPNCRVILTLLILVAGESFAGTMTALPGIPGANEIAWDINDTGVVVGTAYFPGGAALPVRWTGGAIEPLDGPLGTEHCPIFFGDARPESLRLVMTEVKGLARQPGMTMTMSGSLCRPLRALIHGRQLPMQMATLPINYSITLNRRILLSMTV